MPFDVLPREVEVKVGKYQDVADAILRGCAMHPMGVCALYSDGMTCVMGAAFVGAGIPMKDGVGNGEAWETPFGLRLDKVCDIYRDRYGAQPQYHNNSRAFTREQIAARIAAL